MNAPTPPYLKSLVECHNKMLADGYVENFKVEDNMLKCIDCDKTYSPSDITIKNFFRFEGSSDPEDNSIMYVIETIDGKKGTIVDAYGAYSDADTSQFMVEVEKISKKIPHS
ncbi:MAG: hypothetical protein V4725_11480 [Bacteroidota bacterium]|nr:hypothetical protein [Ferruginibacter sp.]